MGGPKPRKSGAPKGWGPRKGGAPKGGAAKGGAPKGGGLKGGGPKFRAFSSLSRHSFFYYFSLSFGLFRGILVVFWKTGALKCARLGSRVVV